MKKWGLDRHQVHDISHAFDVKHTPECRQRNPKGMGKQYWCVCDFVMRIASKVFAIAFDELKDQ